jgi:cyclase
MKKKRVIPVLLLKNGFLVQSKGFGNYQNLGNPLQAVRRLSEWGSDEIIYLDISKNNQYDIKRNDLKYVNKSNYLDIIKEVSKYSFMPMTLGGKIKNLSDVEKRFKVGADKIAINTSALNNPNFISEIAKEFGSQCLVVSIDVKILDNQYVIFSNGGSLKRSVKFEEWIKIVCNNGAGEILINSIDKDGCKTGYDIKMIKIVEKCATIPIIACGGVGEWNHFYEGFAKTNIDAVAAANIFHYVDQSVFLAKKFLFNKNINVRKPNLFKIDN